MKQFWLYVSDITRLEIKSAKKRWLFFSANDLGNKLLSFSGLELKHGIDCYNIKHLIKNLVG